MFSGPARNVVLPDPLQLSGELLPWDSLAEHLSHTLHQDCTLDLDAKRKRASFIDKSCDIREGFNFAHPEQIMKAAQVYVSDVYGFMIYEMASPSQLIQWWGHLYLRFVPTVGHENSPQLGAVGSATRNTLWEAALDL